MQQCLELAEQKLQQMLLEVEAELAQRVAALSKVLLLVPGGGGGGEGLFLCCPTVTLPELLSPRRSADAGVVLPV